jgi:hypothetical protein
MCHQGEDTDQNRVPVENAGFFAEGEVGPQGFEEIAGGV